MKDFVFICGFNNDEIKIVKYIRSVDELISIMYYHHIVSVLLSSLSTAVVSCAPSSSSSPVPVVCWHGVNDNARRFQFYQFWCQSKYHYCNGLSCSSCDGALNHIKQINPDVYTVALMIGDDLDMDTTNSVLMKANDQVKSVNHPQQIMNQC